MSLFGKTGRNIQVSCNASGELRLHITDMVRAWIQSKARLDYDSSLAGNYNVDYRGKISGITAPQGVTVIQGGINGDMVKLSVRVKLRKSDCYHKCIIICPSINAAGVLFCTSCKHVVPFLHFIDENYSKTANNMADLAKFDFQIQKVANFRKRVQMENKRAFRLLNDHATKVLSYRLTQMDGDHCTFENLQSIVSDVLGQNIASMLYLEVVYCLVDWGYLLPTIKPAGFRPSLLAHESTQAYTSELETERKNKIKTDLDRAVRNHASAIIQRDQAIFREESARKDKQAAEARVNDLQIVIDSLKQQLA